MEKKNDNTEVNNNDLTKSVKDMSKEELETYRHTPETELSVLVCKAAETNIYADLKDHLELISKSDPKKIQATDRAGMSALHCAVACTSLPAVMLLLRYGANADAKDMLGFTPLFLATGRYPNTDIASYLINSGHAKVDIATQTGASALHGAALQGNTECVKLLLENGADPRTEDNEGTSPFDLAKDDEIRSILHEAMIERDTKEEASEVVCAQCRKCPKEGDLKRCSQCHVTLYCSRECQAKHWKTGGHRTDCHGFVIARPLIDDGQYGGTQTSFYHVMGSNKKKVKVYTRHANEAPTRMEFLRNKRFVVKVQLPIPVPGQKNMPDIGSEQMMVYNADRTVDGFIYSTEKGYKPLAERIRAEGYMGVKAFFWAELTDKHDGTFRVFHGKTAPFQKW